MSWQMIILVSFVGLVALMFTGLPIAFSFMGFSLVGMFTLMGQFGLRQLILGMYDQVIKFSLTPIPFFMIMGEVFYQSGLVTNTLDALSKFVKKIPGRLSVICLLLGGIFAALSGSVVANTAMFGSLMLPEMARRGYDKSLTTGSIMASGALAMIIPPSSLAVLLGSISGISVGKILTGAVLPGVLLVFLYVGYVIFRCVKDPTLAPTYEVEEVPLSEKLKSFFVDILPLASIFFIVVGLILLGVATPTEAAALGALASYILTIFYRKFSFKLVLNTIISSLKVTTSILIIIAGSAGFSQMLSITGASREAVKFLLALTDSKTLILWIMLVVGIILGFFMEQTAIMMITLPLFMPIVQAYEINQVWFAVMFLICLQLGQLSPPVGLALFTMKSVSPPEVTMQHIYKGAVPFLILDILALFVIWLLPPLTTFLPSL
jgi:tripartite ATP-independent transporter DctM subunit